MTTSNPQNKFVSGFSYILLWNHFIIISKVPFNHSAMKLKKTFQLIALVCITIDIGNWRHSLGINVSERYTQPQQHVLYCARDAVKLSEDFIYNSGILLSLVCNNSSWWLVIGRHLQGQHIFKRQIRVIYQMYHFVK